MLRRMNIHSGTSGRISVWNQEVTYWSIEPQVRASLLSRIAECGTLAVRAASWD